MPFTSHLPTELLLLILSHLASSRQTLLHFSSTCKAHRALLAPRFFANVHFSHDASSADLALSIATKYSFCVHSLTFTGRPEPLEIDAQGHLLTSFNEGLPDTVLPASARRLLLGEITGAKVVHIRYEAGDSDADEAELEAALGNAQSHMRDEYDDDIDPRHVSRCQTLHIWTRRLRAVWGLLVLNPHVRELHVDTPAGGGSTYAGRMDGWAAFMHRLETLSLRIGADVAGGCLADEARIFGSTVDLSFYRLATNVTNLQLNGSRHVRGADAGNHLVRALADVELLPGLRRLGLCNLFIEAALAAFLARHAKSLRRLDLHKCWALDPESSHGAAAHVTWQALFEALARADPVLTALRVWAGADCRFDSDEAAIAADEPDDEDTLYAFPYGECWPRTGLRALSVRLLGERYRDGGDLEAYRRLKDIARRNVAKGEGA